MKRSTVIIVIAILFVVSAAYCLYFFGGYEGLGDGNDYAGLARNILRGEGFSLGHIYPLSLAFDPQIPQPNNMWAPGYPLYLSFWFWIFGVNDNAAVITSIIAVWLLILSGYLLGKKIIGDRLGLVVAALIGFSQIVLYAAVEGTPEILTGAILTFSVIIILTKQNASHTILSGFLFALAVLTRYQIAIVGIPLSIIFIENKKRLLPIWISAVILGLAPWLVRNMIVLGNPFFTLQSYGEFTKGMGRFDDFYFTYRSFTPMTFLYTLSNFPFDFAKKFIAGLIFLGGAFPIRFNYLGVIPFFFALIKIWQMEGIQKKIVLFAFFSSVLIIILSALDGHHDRHLVPLQPFFAVTTIIGFVLLAKEFRFYHRKALAIVLGAFLFMPTRFPYQELTLLQTANESRASQADYAVIAEIVKPDQVVISDASDAIWWYADRPAIWIPVNFDDIKSLFVRDDCYYVYLAKPIDFMNKLKNEELVDFVRSTELMPNFPSSGRLYRLKKNWIPQTVAAL
jgi:4-amino-4-deoxy-L-arabinose transferase-like glycosyltransferase